MFTFDVYFRNIEVINYFYLEKVVSKDQESIQSSTIPGTIQ